MLVDDRRADHAVAAEQDRDFLLVHIGRDLAEVSFHDLADPAWPRSAEQTAKPDLADRVAGRIDNKDQIEFGVAEFGASQEIDGLADRPEGRHGDDLALHHPAGRIIGVGKAFLDKNPVLGRQGGKNVVDLVLLQFLDDVHRIVGIEIGKLARQRRHAHHIDNLVTCGLAEIGQCLGIEAVTEHTDQRGGLRLWQALKQIGLIGRVQRRDKRAAPVLRPFADGCDNGRFDLWRQTIQRGKAVAVVTTVERVGGFCAKLAGSS